MIMMAVVMMMVPGTARGAADPYQWAQENHLIAHALGGFNGMIYTDCLEAFTYSYAHGQRLFEVDLAPTSDGHQACVHDWSAGLMHSLWIPVPAGQENQPMSLAYWKSQKIRNYYTTLSLRDLVLLLQGYRDARFVLDTKISTGTQVVKTFSEIINVTRYFDPQLLDRFLPEIYTEQEYAEVMALYPFKSVLYCPGLVVPETPDEALGVIQRTGIRALSLPDDRTWSTSQYWTLPSTLNQLKASKIYTFFYTVNDQPGAKAMIRDGATGFYTDTILPSQINWTATKKWTIDLPVE